MEITKTFDIELTPEQVAELFCEMDAADQAKFFNKVGRLSADWGAGMFEQQMAAVSKHDSLDTDGDKVMGVIGCN